jgi:hypothetical protein
MFQNVQFGSLLLPGKLWWRQRLFSLDSFHFKVGWLRNRNYDYRNPEDQSDANCLYFVGQTDSGRIGGTVHKNTECIVDIVPKRHAIEGCRSVEVRWRFMRCTTLNTVWSASVPASFVAEKRDPVHTLDRKLGKSCLCFRHAKAKLPLCLIKHHTLKMYWGGWGIDPPFLTSALSGGEWSDSRPLPLYPQYPLDRRLVGPRASLDAVGEKKNLLLLPGIEPRPSSPS